MAGKLRGDFLQDARVQQGMADAAAEIKRIENQGAQTAEHLAASYKGADGAAYHQLVQGWLGYVNRVVTGMNTMVDTSKAASKTTAGLQEGAVDLIRSTNASRAYGALTPNS
ncbi:hypothetical protein [Streptomyces flaveolus]|jgi:uncharacterized protein YukE|uniref:hypothetical protein n=1 Tax=Streptomyces flaveolus TaxID=67297 RepID=UPI0016715E76|nr:hypothetical protein [Streptomyces flaveolus]GGQ79338.1 hypothetical protein GCM10010216_46540 [Streptomyces flaveolus]